MKMFCTSVLVILGALFAFVGYGAWMQGDDSQMFRCLFGSLLSGFWACARCGLIPPIRQWRYVRFEDNFERMGQER